MGTAAAAGWATSPSAEVKPGGRTEDPWGRRRALCHTPACERLQQGTRGDTAWATHSRARVSPGLVPVASGLPGLPAPLLPVSAVHCGRPEADLNAVVHGNDWWVGSVVRYSCRPGFLLLGDPASACQSDGRWTPRPSCLREYPGATGGSSSASPSPPCRGELQVSTP